MSTEDLLEIMKLLRAEANRLDSASGDGTGDYEIGMVAGIELALTMLDEKFGVELDAYEKQGEEEEAS
jgi:hypothetical protein